jgi:hypothetical protein
MNRKSFASPMRCSVRSRVPLLLAFDWFVKRSLAIGWLLIIVGRIDNCSALDRENVLVAQTANRALVQSAP